MILMRHRIVLSLMIVSSMSYAALRAQTAGRGADAAEMKNPVKADAASIAAGKKLYDSNCAPCHGETARGDGKMASQFNPKPPDLTDADWKHGSSDGEIFVVVRDGVKDTAMKAFGSKMTAHQMWDVVNYVRSLAPAKSH